jgi:glycerol-3-phosphate acyltransferase PlsY
MIIFALMVVAAYLIGSIPFGVIVGRLRGFDPRAVGSGNIGMTNVVRAGGGSAAALTFVGDILKGAIPVIVARAIGFVPAAVAWVALAAFLGSIYSIFLRFHGGKGISAALGIWIVLAPLALLIALAVWGTTLAVFRIMSVASIAAAVVLPIATALVGVPHPYQLLAIAVSLLAILRHRENLSRLLRGEESKLGARKGDGQAVQQT